MHVGLVMECDYRYGETEEAAFDEAFAMAEAAKSAGSTACGWPSGTSLPTTARMTPEDSAYPPSCPRR